MTQLPPKFPYPTAHAVHEDEPAVEHSSHAVSHSRQLCPERYYWVPQTSQLPPTRPYPAAQLVQAAVPAAEHPLHAVLQGLQILNAVNC